MSSTGAEVGHDASPVLVSACMLGLNTRYDGGNCHRPGLLQDELAGLHVVPVCPEQLGGLPTPRDPAEISEGDGADVLKGEASVFTLKGKDVTDNYLRGAREVRRLARLLNIERAYLKEKSPSCGVTTIVRDGRHEPGRGVTAALLADSGVEISGVK